MKHYIIDGNNLIGKISLLKNTQQKDKQASREKLSFMIERFFQTKKAKISLHFDGFANLPIKTSKTKIIYSENRTADEKIKQEIENSKSRTSLIIVSSDNGIKDFARVCSCEVLLSEDFAKELQNNKSENEESEKIKSINNKESNEEFKKLFDEK
ncbi:MAG: NYN domain-containing protein [Ignavibacteriaceae bacterium]